MSNSPSSWVSLWEQECLCSTWSSPWPLHPTGRKGNFYLLKEQPKWTSIFLCGTPSSIPTFSLKPLYFIQGQYEQGRYGSFMTVLENSSLVLVPVLAGAMFVAFSVKNGNRYFLFLSAMKEVWRQTVQFGDSSMSPGTRLLLDQGSPAPGHRLILVSGLLRIRPQSRR